MGFGANAESRLNDIRGQHCSLAILRCLASCASFSSNDAVLGDYLTTLGLSYSRDHLRSIMRALEEKGALTLAWEEGCAVATLTRTGEEVAMGTVRMEGVRRLDPDCPY